MHPLLRPADGHRVVPIGHDGRVSDPGHVADGARDAWAPWTRWLAGQLWGPLRGRLLQHDRPSALAGRRHRLVLARFREIGGVLPGDDEHQNTGGRAECCVPVEETDRKAAMITRTYHALGVTDPAHVEVQTGS